MKITKEEYEKIEKFFELLMDFNNHYAYLDFNDYIENDNIHKIKIINGNKRIVRQFKIKEYDKYKESYHDMLYRNLISEKFTINDQILAETTSRITAKGKYLYEYFFYEEVLNKFNLFDIK